MAFNIDIKLKTIYLVPGLGPCSPKINQSPVRIDCVFSEIREIITETLHALQIVSVMNACLLKSRENSASRIETKCRLHYVSKMKGNESPSASPNVT